MPKRGFYYNRFRYYDPATGNYISQDPIGLEGGNPTIYGYVKDTNSWIDVFGLGPWGDGDFGTWFDKASTQDIIDNKTAVSQALRGDGGTHEMFPVSMAAKAKELGFTHAELMGMTVDTKSITFVDVPDSKGVLHTGKHPSVGVYNSTASSNFHKKMMADLKTAKTKQEALDIIKKHHDTHMKVPSCH
jgi:uncharacterized protein RhaS with RHS repeats